MKENEIPEIVGARDLREVFDGNRSVRGGLFINNVEVPAMSVNGISALLAAINSVSSRSFVDASIDDGYHLVLEARSPAPISIRAGAIYQEPPPAPGTVDASAQAVTTAIREGRRGDRDERNTILDDLGLEATDGQEQPQAAGPAHPAAGMTAEERHKARHERAMAAGAIRGYQPMTNRQGNLPERAVREDRTEDERFNPTPSQRRIPGAGGNPNRAA